MKGQLQGQAKALLGFVGTAELGGEVQSIRRRVFQNSPQFFAAQRDAYLAYVFCVLILQDKTIPTSDKFRAIQEFKKPPPLSQTDAPSLQFSEPESTLAKYVGLSLPEIRPGGTFKRTNLDLKPWMLVVGSYEFTNSSFFGSNVEMTLYSRTGSDRISLIVIHSTGDEAQNCFLYNLLHGIRNDLGEPNSAELVNYVSNSYRENSSNFTETIDQTLDDAIKGIKFKYVKRNFIEDPDESDHYYLTSEEWLYLSRE